MGPPHGHRGGRACAENYAAWSEAEKQRFLIGLLGDADGGGLATRSAEWAAVWASTEYPSEIANVIDTFKMLRELPREAVREPKRAVVGCMHCCTLRMVPLLHAALLQGAVLHAGTVHPPRSHAKLNGVSAAASVGPRAGLH